MAWRQGHLVNFSYVPTMEQKSSRVRICFDLFDEGGELVMLGTVRSLPAPPLRTIHGAEIAPSFSEIVFGKDAGLKHIHRDVLACCLDVLLMWPIRPNAHA